jgi:hypothetical protein
MENFSISHELVARLNVFLKSFDGGRESQHLGDGPQKPHHSIVSRSRDDLNVIRAAPAALIFKFNIISRGFHGMK